MTRARPQKVTNIRAAENRKLSTWVPPGGSGIGLWKGIRTYFLNGTPQTGGVAGLTIRSPMGDNIAGGAKNVAKGTLGLAIQGAKDIYGLTKGTSNALLGMASPWNLAAMGRTRKNIAKLGIKPPKKQSEEVRFRIAENQAKLKLFGFDTELKETTPFKNQITSDKQIAKKIINQDKKKLEELEIQATDPEQINKIAGLKQLTNDNSDKVNTGFPAEVSEVEKQKGRTRWVGGNTTWKDRWGNVIAPKVKGPTKEEQKKMIMTSLEQEMYD